MSKKVKIASILGVLSLILITSGVTLAFFQYVKNGQTENSITTDGITFIYTEESKIGKGIILEDAMPMTDEQGKTQTNQKFDFRIVSKPGNTKIKYTVTARKISSGDTLDSLVNLYLTDQKVSNPEVFLDKTAFSELNSYKSSTVEKVLYEKVIDKNDTTNGEYNQEFRLRMWLDSSADFSDGTLNNKEFKIIVNVNAVNYNANASTNSKPTLGEMIIADNELITSEPTMYRPSNESSDESGLYSLDVTDGYSNGADGTTYYFRGNVDNNFVDFAGFVWRVVRVNEDGSVRLILNDTLDNAIYNTSKTTVASLYYSNSTIKDTVNTWYQENIGNNQEYASKIADGEYFCEAAKVGFEASSAGSAVLQKYSNYTPDYKCVADGNGKGLLDNTYKVGFLTYDEVVRAGGYYMYSNEDYYLYNGTIYWTMSGRSYKYYKTSGYTTSIWDINQGYLDGNSPSTTYVGIRPVINLKRETYATVDEITGHYVVGNGERVLTEASRRANINSISVNGTELKEISENQYETRLPLGTTSANLNVVPENLYSTVSGVSINCDSSETISPITNNIQLSNGNNCFKVTVTSEDGKVTNTKNIKIYVGEPRLLREMILEDNSLVTTQPTLNKQMVDTTDESGLYSLDVTNGYSNGASGTTYYFRGDINNNYVNYAGLVWRVIRVNEDGTIRLILEDGINLNSKYAFNTNYNGYEKVYFSNSEIKNTLKSWYDTVIGSNNDYSSRIAEGSYFCEEAKVGYQAQTLGNVEMVSYENYTPNYTCQADANGKGLLDSTYKIGLITYDEAVRAGAYTKINSKNTKLFLYKDYDWWSMTPGGTDSGSMEYADAWALFKYSYSSFGLSSGIYAASTPTQYAVRPVINLKADTRADKDVTTGHYEYRIVN